MSLKNHSSAWINSNEGDGEMKKGFKSIIIAMGVLTLYLIISLWTNVTIENTNMGVLMSVSRK